MKEPVIFYLCFVSLCWGLVSIIVLSVYDTEFYYLIALLGGAFIMMKNGIYFIITAFLVAELFKILIMQIEGLVMSVQRGHKRM